MILTDIYTELLYRPIFNLLVFFYNVIPIEDIGLAIIVVTLLVKFALLPLSRKSIKAQRQLQILQPKLDEIKNQFKNDKEKQSKELMKFYKDNNVNPFSSCLPLLIQFPILIAMYRVFRNFSNPAELGFLYAAVSNPGVLNTIAFGFIDFANPNIYLAVLAGGLQFVQSWMLMRRRKKEEDSKKKKKQVSKGAVADITSSMSKQMMYVMPIMTIFIASRFPSGLAFYWVINTLFSIGQQWFIMRNEKS